MEVIDIDDYEFKTVIPNMPYDNAYSIKLILPSTGDHVDRNVVYDKYKMFISDNDIVIKMKDIDFDG